MSLWQLTNGRAFIQVIYSRDDELIDCEYLTRKSFVNEFTQTFYNEIYRAGKLRNNPLLTNISMVASHQEQKQQHSDEPSSDYSYFDENENQDVFGLRNLSYHQLWSESDIPDDLRPLMNYDLLKKQCDNRHEQLKHIVDGLGSNDVTERTNATEHLNR